jgi:phosphoribosylaminoimidazole-succinocarboxamide synthase
METDLPGALKKRRGKVRDVYEYADGLLIVATDRISAFDVILPNGVSGKGKVLNGLSVFWFNLTKDLVPNHLISTDVNDFPEVIGAAREGLVDRAMWCRKAQVVPIEGVVRGYLAGSGWKAYRKGEPVCGHVLPPGLVESAELPEPIFTPTTKEEHGHDRPIDLEEMGVLLRDDNLALQLEEVSLKLYSFARDYAAQRGFILCDTKFEFGMIDGQLTLVDEILTPDSSRYWDATKYAPGRPQESFDKQYVRDYLETLDWNKEPPGPELPSEVIENTRRIYGECYRRVTGVEVNW